MENRADLDAAQDEIRTLRYQHAALHETLDATHRDAWAMLDERQDALQAAQDEIERRISECETHRALVDAVLVERDAEAAWEALPIVPWSEEHSAALRGFHVARRHRRSVVDSIGDA